MGRGCVWGVGGRVKIGLIPFALVTPETAILPLCP